MSPLKALEKVLPLYKNRSAAAGTTTQVGQEWAARKVSRRDAVAFPAR